MGANWVDRWSGGRIRVEKSGRRVWVIERSIARRRYAIALDVATEHEAIAELVAFEKGPAAYAAARAAPASAAAPARLVIDRDLLAKFLIWAEQQELSRDYRKHILESYMEAWIDLWAGRDFLGLGLADLRAQLKSWPTARKHRVIALKSFTAWLREETNLLDARNDPTLGLLTVTDRKSKRLKSKALELDDVEVVYRAVRFQGVRDLICLGAKNGMHQTEIARIAQGPELARLKRVGPWPDCPIVGTLTFLHKRRDPHTVSLDAQSYAAAERIQRDGVPSGSKAYDHLREIAERFKVPHVRLGALRHSFITWCRTPGLRGVGVTKASPPMAALSLQDVADITGHRSTKTTSHYYDFADAVPFLAVVPIHLRHIDDPPISTAPVRSLPEARERNRP